MSKPIEADIKELQRLAANEILEKASQIAEVLLRIGRVSSIPAAIRMMKEPAPE